MRAFWAYIEVDEELVSQKQVTDICEEIAGNVSHVLQVTANAPTQEN